MSRKKTIDFIGKAMAELKADEKNTDEQTNEMPIENANTKDGSIENLFMNKAGFGHINVRRSSADENKLLFTFDDVVKTMHPLAKILRMILVDCKMTHAEFDERHRAFGEASGLLATQVNYNRNNIKKAMLRDRLSYSMFENIVHVILGFGLKDLIFQLVNPNTGEVVEYSLAKIQKQIDEHYNQKPNSTPLHLSYNEEEDEKE